MLLVLYMRDPANANEVDSCHYAFPLPISPVVCPTTWKVIKIDLLPTGADNTIGPLKPWIPKPANEYVPEYQRNPEVPARAPVAAGGHGG